MWRLVRVLSLLVVVLFVVALGGPLYAQTANAGLQRLEAAASGPLDVTVNGTTGFPSFIRGQIPVAAGRTATDPAIPAGAFLNAYGSALGIVNPATELKLLMTKSDGLGMSQVLWQQVVNGVPVYHAQVGVHLAAGNTVIVAATSGFWPGLDAPVARPRITAGQALANARPAMPGGVVNAGPTLVIYPYDNGLTGRQARLSWIIDIGNDSIPARNLYAVDALTGYLFEVVNLLTGVTYHPAAQNPGVASGQSTSPDTQWFSGTDSGQAILAGLYRETYDAEHTKSLPGTLVRKEGEGPVDDPDTDQAHDFAGDVYNYYLNSHGRDSYDDLGSPIISTVHYGLNYNNAGWTGSQMLYGDGTAVLDVIGHELTHGVISTTADLEYRWQSGAMNESLADIFGAMIDRDDWLMGEDLSPDMLAGREALRDLSDPTRFGHPAHVDDWVSTCSDEEGVHTNSGIFNKAYYNIATSLDKARAERIFYRALTVYLRATSSLEDGRAAAIQAAVDLYGHGTEEEQVKAGFDAVGLDGSWNPSSNNCGSCAVTALTSDEGLFAEAIAGLRTVTTLYRVRDTLLETTVRGRHYSDLYAANTGAITRLLAKDGSLRRQGATLLRVTQPDLDQLANGQGNEAVITRELVADVKVFLLNLATSARNDGDDELAQTIDREMQRIDWNKLVGMTYEEAWAYLNAPLTQFVPLITR